MERGLRRQKILPQASACCAKSPKFSDFPGVDPAQQQVRLNVTGVLYYGGEFTANIPGFTSTRFVIVMHWIFGQNLSPVVLFKTLLFEKLINIFLFIKSVEDKLQKINIQETNKQRFF